MESNLERMELERQTEVAFAHMQELMDQLDAVNEKNEYYRKASHANQAIKYNRGIRPLENEYEDLKARAHWAKVAKDEPLQASIAKLIDYRETPLNMFKQLLESELKQGGFESIEEAKKYRMKDEALEAMKAELEAYRKDYQETLAECQRLDELLGDEEEENGETPAEE